MSTHLVCTNDVIKCIAFLRVQNDDIIKCIAFFFFWSQEEKVGETEGGKIHST